jgi:glycosyltransferase involved in cell wall biosynthesis
VRLPGADANPYRFMARAAAVVLSSRVEGLPAVLVEALALGVPVVSTDCPSGPRDLLADGRFGRLVPVGDAPALATAIEEVLDRPPPPAPTEAWEDYRVDRAGAAFHDVLRQVWRDDATSRHSRS